MGCGRLRARGPRHRMRGLNYRAIYERFAGRPSRTTTSAPITDRLTRRRPRRRSGSTAAWCGRTRSTTTRRSAVSSARLNCDPDLAIARWGIAYSIGPNYNKAWEAFDPVDLAASLARARDGTRAGRRTGGPRPSSADLIEALQARFPTDDPERRRRLTARAHGRYADAMVEARRRPTPTTSTCRRSPPTRWSTSRRGRCGTPEPASPRLVRGSSQAKRILDDALATPAGREHPGVLHLYLHAMEMSATPQDALPAADLLRDLVPDAGHLQHMASHIDVLCGDYRNSVVANLTAVQADRLFVEREGPLNFYSLYRAHDLHFVVYSAMFEGKYATALRGRRRTRRTAHARTCWRSSRRRWPTGWKRSCRCGFTCWSGSASGTT